ATPASSSTPASRSPARTHSRSWSAPATRSMLWFAKSSARFCRSEDADLNEKLDLTLNINGRDHAVRVEPRKTLVDTIRDDCGLTGTHIGCEHGVCGACTVILGDDAIRSCLMFAVQAQGKPIRTVEGLAQN